MRPALFQVRSPSAAKAAMPSFAPCLYPGHAVGLELGNDVGGDFIVEARPASTCGHARLLEAPGRQCNAFADMIDPDVVAGRTCQWRIYPSAYRWDDERSEVQHAG